jgi:hypothetical protein
MTDYDTFPLLSAAMMLVHKYGIFMLFCVYSLTMVRLPTRTAPRHACANWRRRRRRAAAISAAGSGWSAASVDKLA